MPKPRPSKLRRVEILVSDDMFDTLERLKEENRVSMGAIAKAALDRCDLAELAASLRAAKGFEPRKAA